MIDYIQKIIEHSIAIEKENKEESDWISVKDCDPHKDKNNHSQTVNVLQENGTISQGEFNHNIGAWFNGGYIIKVTHWKYKNN